ncbi:LURP-one-related 10-like protein [Tanacetum coccineum]
MMAEPSDFAPPDDVPISVIDSKFTASYVVDLIFVTNSRGDHTITDGQSGVLFTVNPFGAILHDQLVLRDTNDEIIVTLRKKIRSLHKRWCVFRGAGNDKLLFSVKKEHDTIQSRTNLHVFLANNHSEDVCDFKIAGCSSNRSFSIYTRDSSRKIAKTHKMHVKDKFLVKVSPNVDYAFVSTLVSVIEAMKWSGV